LKEEATFSPGFSDEKTKFYDNIKCGILHQAETKDGYRILRKGPLLDSTKKTINAATFLGALKRCLDRYVREIALVPK
jgi:hypothetical protein